jgi:lipoprotein-releasing system permease protein
VLFQLKLLRRTLFARRRGLVRFTALVAVAGIAAGVASLIVAQAIGRGFQAELRDKILAASPHIYIFRKDKAEISDAPQTAEIVRSIEGVTEARPFASYSAVITGNTSSAYAVVHVEKSKSSQAAGNAEIGVELAASTGLNVGDEAGLTIIGASGEPLSRRVRISGLIRTGLFEQDSTRVEMASSPTGSPETLESFLPTAFDIRVNDIYRAPVIAEQVRTVLGPDFRVVDWQEANEPLFAALSLERRAALAVIFLIVFVAVLNITTTLSLLVAERRLDIAVLRTCGAKARTLVSMFIIEGCDLRACGSGGRCGVRGRRMRGCKLFRIIPPGPASVFGRKYLPVAEPFGTSCFRPLRRSRFAWSLRSIRHFGRAGSSRSKTSATNKG